MAISGSSIGHHQGQNVSNSGEEMRSPSFSHPPLDEKVDEAGWGCTLTFLFSANVQEHPRRTMTLLRTAHLLPQRDPELFSSALSTMCTGSHWDLLTKDSPVISLNLLYFTGSPCLLSWMKTDKADAIFSCLPPPPPHQFYLIFPCLRLFSGLVSAFLFPAEPGENCTPLDMSLEQKLVEIGRTGLLLYTYFLMNRSFSLKVGDMFIPKQNYVREMGGILWVFLMFIYYSQGFLKTFVPL